MIELLSFQLFLGGPETYSVQPDVYYIMNNRGPNHKECCCHRMSNVPSVVPEVAVLIKKAQKK